MSSKFCLVATMRNEGPFILEWLAYHRHIGFNEIIVCSNDCVDGSAELLDELDRAGWLHHIRCDPGPEDKPQLFAYAKADEQLKLADGDWAMVLDADEFLNIHVGRGTVQDLVASTPDATAFMINWRVFGNSGFDEWSSELVMRRFTRAASLDSGVNLSFKTLFTKAEAYHCRLLPHGPGFAKPSAVGELRCVGGDGKLLPPRYAAAEEFLQSEPGTVSWKLAQINHYNTRSWQDYLVKHRRTGGLHQWDRDVNWNAFNRNEEVDLSIQRHLPGVEEAVRELLSDSRIHARFQQCCSLYAEHVDQLARSARDPV